MRVTRISAVTTLLLTGVVAVGCGPKSAGTGSGTAGSKQGGKSVLELLHRDAKGSLILVSDTAKKANSAHVLVTSTTAGQPVSMDGVIAFGDNPRAELVMDAPAQGTKTTIRLVDNKVFMSIPEANMPMVGGKKWLRLNTDSSATATATGNGKDLAERLRNSSPIQTVQLMIDSGALTVAGDETIDGTNTVHYSGTMSAEQYAKTVGASAASVKLDGSDVKLDAWIDEKYQVRRSRSASALVEATCEYSDYGVPVTIQAPSASEAIDMSDYFAAMLNKKE